ncbi:MAG: quinone-dependent dihydroorotate dehydrogenase [Planctomycetota bacterium]|jgi:dihydroorotate dehydrogenase
MKAVLFRLDPERVHDLALRSARRGGSGLAWLCGGREVKGRARELAGIRFRNPLGLAAGMDKNGVALPFWRALGFGFVEVGTVTPRPQPGNPRPRLWRFPRHRALGNHLGFPSDGAAMVAARLKRDKLAGDVIGINLGKNRETPLERAAEDYVAALDATRSVADYFAVNVSSPNTPELRKLQSKEYLADLLDRVRRAAREVPVFVKLSPDLDEQRLAEAAAVCVASGCAGIIATNTTLARPEGMAPFAGGLSGRPLAARAREVLGRLRELVGSGVPLVSVGGIDSPAEAERRLAEGADLIQIYTGLVFEGPRLPARILRGL